MNNEECVETIETKYNKPIFEYWDRVIIGWCKKFPSKESGSAVAQFYVWEVWTIIDICTHHNSPYEYCIILDDNLWTQFDDMANKCVWIEEKYLKEYDDFEELEEEGYCCPYYSRNLSNSELLNGLMSAYEDIIKNDDDELSVSLAKEMIEVIEKAKKYDNLNK